MCVCEERKGTERRCDLWSSMMQKEGDEVWLTQLVDS